MSRTRPKAKPVEFSTTSRLKKSAGKEQRGRHPGVILSAYKFNLATGFAFIAPITTVGNASRLHGFAVPLTGQYGGDRYHSGEADEIIWTSASGAPKKHPTACLMRS